MSFATLTRVFRDVFENETLQVTPTLAARDVENWDSFNHINLIVALEETFAVTFTTEEITGMQNVGDLVTVLNAKGHDIHFE